MDYYYMVGHVKALNSILCWSVGILLIAGGLTVSGAEVAEKDQASSQTPGPQQIETLVLQPLYRVAYQDRAFMSSTNAFAKPAPLGQTGYLARNPLLGGKALYKFFNKSSGIYRDATGLDAPWEKMELLGYTFPDSKDHVLLKEYQDEAGHYVTLNENETPPNGYRFAVNLGYAFERFGPELVRCLNLKADDVEFRFDRVCGGALWHILHKGVQLVNNAYYGRQGCVALDLWMPGMDLKKQERLIPCDCGLTAAVRRWMTDVSFRMGAPCPVFRREGDQLVIRTIPVESVERTTHNLGGRAINPVIYPTLDMEKRARLVPGQSGVMQLHLKLEIPAADLAATRMQRVNICGLHLVTFMNHLTLFNPQTGGQTNIPAWTTSPRSQQFKKFYAPGGLAFQNDKANYTRFDDFTCVIMHDGGTHAVGMMAAGPDATPAGSVQYFLGYFWKKFTNHPGDPDTPEFSNNTIEISAMSDVVRPGKNDYFIYLLAGSLLEVIAASRGIYQQRHSLSW